MLMILLYIVIGFAAEMIDGSLGMGYGVSCRTFIRATAGTPAAIASAVVHISEIFASLASGISHLRAGNVDKKLLIKLMIPGVVGGVLGAWLLSGLGDKLEIFIDIYLIIMGIMILYKAFSKSSKRLNMDKAIYPLGFAGGFLDACGGGGWGPVVTSTMIATGQDAKKTIGTVNAAEFFVTIAQTTAFIVLIQDFFSYWQIIVGLIIGGVIAAPIAARVCRRLPVRPLMIAVGILVIALNIYNLIHFLITHTM